jgi:hypothetical protein
MCWRSYFGDSTDALRPPAPKPRLLGRPALRPIRLPGQVGGRHKSGRPPGHSLYLSVCPPLKLPPTCDLRVAGLKGPATVPGRYIWVINSLHMFFHPCILFYYIDLIDI